MLRQCNAIETARRIELVSGVEYTLHLPYTGLQRKSETYKIVNFSLKPCPRLELSHLPDFFATAR